MEQSPKNKLIDQVMSVYREESKEVLLERVHSLLSSQNQNAIVVLHQQQFPEGSEHVKKLYMATVRLAFIAEGEAEAEDAVSEMLTGNLQHNGAIVDWAYTRDEKQPLGFSVPEYVAMINPEAYVEYSFVRLHESKKL